jgi:predicted RecB family nuclease
MNLSASDFYSLYRPSECTRRVFLRSHHEPEAEPSEFDKLIEELGKRHEANHLATFPEFLDLKDGDLDSRTAKTIEALHKGVDVVYQGVFQARLPGTGDIIVGIPDFMIKDAEGYKIRDCKLARHVDEGRHEEILLQLQLYGWLFEQTVKESPKALEVCLGDEIISKVPYDGGLAALEVLNEIAGISRQSAEPYSPVGWSKCGACGYKKRCWNIAEKSNDLALVYELDQGTAKALKDQGVLTIEQLLNNYNGDTLSELKKLRGQKMVRVGKAAERILLQAQALQMKQEKLLESLDLPQAQDMVMFDLEGLPPQFDDLDKVYLWGTQVYGMRPGKFLPALAGFGSKGDEEGWAHFLGNAEGIFKEYGDLPFIHWHNYETTKVKSYIGRYTDPKGIGQRVLDNCVDLLKITRDALVLPEYSYSLKVVEKRTGFKRTMNEFGGDWSIVQYIRAVETQDEGLRTKIMTDILKYNEEDLKATWAVLEWLKTKRMWRIEL